MNDNNKYEVVGWLNVNFEDTFNISVGGLGGWFNYDTNNPDINSVKAEHRWIDFLETYNDDVHDYLEAIKEAVLDEGLQITGYDHCCSDCGIPLFDDDTIAVLSGRAWADLMAAIWSEHDDKSYSYMEFYYGSWLEN